MGPKADLKMWRDTPQEANLKNDVSSYTMDSWRTPVTEERIEKKIESLSIYLRELKADKVKRDDAHLRAVLWALPQNKVPQEVLQEYLDRGILKKKEGNMNREAIARELLKIAHRLLAEVEEIEEVEPQGSTPVKERRKKAGAAREFQENIDAISEVQKFIEDDALTFDALSGRMAQTNLKRASKHLASARSEMYYAWDNRDKTRPV